MTVTQCLIFFRRRDTACLRNPCVVGPISARRQVLHCIVLCSNRRESSSSGRRRDVDGDVGCRVASSACPGPTGASSLWIDSFYSNCKERSPLLIRYNRIIADKLQVCRIHNNFNNYCFFYKMSIRLCVTEYRNIVACGLKFRVKGRPGEEEHFR